MSTATVVEGALSKLASMLAKTRSTPENVVKDATRVGERFMTAADDPLFFERGRKFALGEQGRGVQFGVTPKAATPSAVDREYYGESFRAMPGSPDAKFFEKELSYPEVRNMSQTSNVRDIQQSGLLRPGANYRIYDSSNLGSGSGQGTRHYAAAYGSLLDKPETYNLVESLSPENAVRRNYNQSSAIMRDPRLADRILTSASQMKMLPPELTSRRFHALDPTQQVGALQMSGAASTLEELKFKLQNSVIRMQNAAIPAAERRALEHQIFQLSSAINRMSSEGSGALQSIVPHAQRLDPNSSRFVPLGDRTARKMGMTLEALQGHPSEGSIRGLEFSGGGRVPQQGLCGCSH